MSTTYSNITHLSSSKIDLNGISYFFNIDPFFYNDITYTSKLFQDNLTFMSALSQNIFIKNNPEDIYKFFPHMQNTLTDLEVIFDEIKDESTLEYIRTIPDGKLYYPEPFIASPSFLHKEI